MGTQDLAGTEGERADDDPLGVALDPANVLPVRLARWAQVDPARPFLSEIGGRSVTYGTFHTELLQWCTLLRRSGVRPGDTVASLLPASIDGYLLWLAASCIGAIEAPVNRELRGEFLHHVLSDSRARLCFSRPEDAGLPATSGVAGVEVVVADAGVPLVRDLPAEPLARYPTPGDASTIIYTSGTTGPAKGVVMTWAQISASIGRIPRRWLSETDVVYSPWPIFHVTGRGPLVSMADVSGRVVIRERFSLGDFWPDIRRHGCTSATVGMVLALLLSAPPDPLEGENPLRVVFMSTVGRQGLEFQRRFGVKVVGCYGSTEIGFPMVNRNPTVEDQAVLAGWLRPGYEARVVDEHGAEVAPGTTGELLVRPPDRRLMLREYFGQPELTARAVVDGWYRTGDAVIAYDDGSYRFVDRLRDTIRRFGEGISSSALEAAVLQDPEVAECVAIGVPSAVAGQEVLLAVIAPPGVELDPAALFERLRPRLPRHMLPAFVSVHDTLPKTPNGKIRKVAVPADVSAPHVWTSPVATTGRADG